MTNSISRLYELRKGLWKDYKLIVKQKENYWFQQSRSKWLLLGDCNSNFFHQAAIIKRRRNRITSLLGLTNAWIYDDDGFHPIFSSNLNGILLVTLFSLWLMIVSMNQVRL